MRVLYSVLVLGCASTVAADPPYGGTLRSVEFLANTVLRKEPRSDAPAVGIIRKGARARAVAAVPAGNGCTERWI